MVPFAPEFGQRHLKDGIWTARDPGRARDPESDLKPLIPNRHEARSADPWAGKHCGSQIDQRSKGSRLLSMIHFCPEPNLCSLGMGLPWAERISVPQSLGAPEAALGALCSSQLWGDIPRCPSLPCPEHQAGRKGRQTPGSP